MHQTECTYRPRQDPIRTRRGILGDILRFKKMVYTVHQQETRKTYRVGNRMAKKTICHPERTAIHDREVHTRVDSIFWGRYVHETTNSQTGSQSRLTKN
jgi:hypothetical protein